MIRLTSSLSSRMVTQHTILSFEYIFCVLWLLCTCWPKSGENKYLLDGSNDFLTKGGSDHSRTKQIIFFQIVFLELNSVKGELEGQSKLNFSNAWNSWALYLPFQIDMDKKNLKRKERDCARYKMLYFLVAAQEQTTENSDFLQSSLKQKGLLTCLNDSILWVNYKTFYCLLDCSGSIHVLVRSNKNIVLPSIELYNTFLSYLGLNSEWIYVYPSTGRRDIYDFITLSCLSGCS